MKKTIKLLILFFLVTALSVILIGCKDNKTPKNLKITNDDFLIWDAVDGADGYTVIMDGDGGDRFFSATNSFDIFELTTKHEVIYTFSVYAMKNGEQYSDISETVEYVMDSKLWWMYEYSYGLEIMPCEPENWRGKVVVPATFDGKAVLKVKDGSFNDLDNITSIYFKDGIQVGSDIIGCDNLTRVHFPETMAATGYIEDCPLIENIQFPESMERIARISNCRSLKSIYLPESLRMMDRITDCPLIEELDLPASLTSFAGSLNTPVRKSYAITGCPNLKKITVSTENPYIKSDGNCVILKENNKLVFAINGASIPEYVTEIAENAFYGLDIDEIFIPKNVNFISDEAFVKCNKLDRITVDADNATYRSESNCIIERESQTLILANASVTIPQGVKIIGPHAVAYRKPTSLIIPEGVEIIDEAAFWACDELVSVRFPSSLKEIKNEAFRECSKLKLVIVNEKIERMGDRVFAECGFGLNIYIPAAKAGIGKDIAPLGSVVYMPSVDMRSIGAFGDIATVYTALRHENDENKKNFKSSGIVYNCNFKYDEQGLPYVVSFSSKIEEKDGKKILSSMYFESVDQLVAPSRDGYTFVGWALTENGTVIVPAERKITISGIVEHISVMGFITYEHINIENVDYMSAMTKSQYESLLQNDEITLYAIWEKNR